MRLGEGKPAYRPGQNQPCGFPMLAREFAGCRLYPAAFAGGCPVGQSRHDPLALEGFGSPPEAASVDQPGLAIPVIVIPDGYDSNLDHRRKIPRHGPKRLVASKSGEALFARKSRRRILMAAETRGGRRYSGAQAPKVLFSPLGRRGGDCWRQARAKPTQAGIVARWRGLETR